MKRYENFELTIRIKINILEKNPQNGGTPAIDKSVTIKIFDKILVDPNAENECSVFVSQLKNWNRIEKKTSNERL